jgi:hypothetical protein
MGFIKGKKFVKKCRIIALLTTGKVQQDNICEGLSAACGLQ